MQHLHHARRPGILVAALAAVLTAVLIIGCQRSVNPGINERWKSDDIDPLVERLESESREIYTNRQVLAEVVAPRPGSVVADIGAGSGFMAELFAGQVGPDGLVYAVDINASLMDLVATRARRDGITNLRTVVCTERSVELPADSVDLMFICDTYHHFEPAGRAGHGRAERVRLARAVAAPLLQCEPGVRA